MSKLCDHFLGWQCRQRQHAVRHEGGRPSPAMCPQVLIDAQPVAQLVVLINKSEPQEATLEFRHMVLRTADPAEHYKSAVRTFSELYFQYPGEFSQVLTASFSEVSPLADRLLERVQCELEFDYQRQYYSIPCAVTQLAQSDPAYQATYWHNRLYNRAMPAGVRVLAFTPDWKHAKARPPAPSS